MIADDHKRADWGSIVGIVVAVLGFIGSLVVGLVAGYLAAEDDRKASLREDSREAYIGLLVAADSCADVADEIAVGRAYVEELSSADTQPDDAEPAGDDPILQAIEARDLCTQRLNSALAVIMLLTPSDSGDDQTTVTTAAGTPTASLAPTDSSVPASASTSVRTSTPATTEEPTTDDPTIRNSANELKDRAISLYDAELNVLKAEPRGEPFVSTARSQADQAEVRYNTAVDRFVEVAGAETRKGEGFFGTRGWIMVSVVGAIVLAGVAVFVFVWSLRRRSAARRKRPVGPLWLPGKEAQEGERGPVT